MSYTYAEKKRTEGAPKRDAAPARGPSPEALRSGTAAPTAEQKGHRVDLPEAMREKMESAFGADLSAVKLYESEAVGEAGAEAVARGGEIAFAPGMLDFSSFGGQALLGHEISHVVSQARGEVTGSGFLNDHALEARADREGAMAAAGQTVAPPAAAMSALSAGGAEGPMQASKEDKYRKRETEAYDSFARDRRNLDKQAEYEKFRNKKAARMRKRGASEEDIAADSQAISSTSAVLERSKQKFFTPEGSDHMGYLKDLFSLMNGMDDEELRGNRAFQEETVDAYAAAHRASSPANSSSMFMDSGPRLTDMYARIMGKDKIQKTMRGQRTLPEWQDTAPDLDTNGEINQDTAVHRIRRLADDSGVIGLMLRQFEKTYDQSTNRHPDPDLPMNSMRDFWGGAVLGNASGSQKSSDAAAQVYNTLRGVKNDDVVSFLNGAPLPKTEGSLGSLEATRFLLSIGPDSLSRSILDRAPEQPQAPSVPAPEPVRAAPKRPYRGPTLRSTPLSQMPEVIYTHDPNEPTESEKVAAIMEEDAPKKKKHHHNHHHHHHHGDK